MPVSAISSVRGIGVAVIVSTSTLARNCFSRSLCATPNRCSSSTTNRPRSLNAMSLPSSRCVPITTSTLPATTSATVRFCSAGADEPAQHRHRHGEGREALAERDEVLLGEQRGGHQHRDLLALHHGLERRAQRDLRLAEPDVAADQAVHRLRPLHVALDLVDRRQLVAGLLVRERVLQLLPATACRGRTRGRARTSGPCRGGPARPPCPCTARFTFAVARAQSRAAHAVQPRARRRPRSGPPSPPGPRARTACRPPRTPG